MQNSGLKGKLTEKTVEVKKKEAKIRVTQARVQSKNKQAHTLKHKLEF
jgi:hypothetical protein